MSFSLLSITHGREELLWKCLSSLGPWDENWQLVIVANGARLSEKNLSLSQELSPQAMIIDLPTTVTPGKARNEGLKFCTKDWVFFLDDDAYLTPGYFQQALPLLQRAEIDIFGGPDAPAPGRNTFGYALALTLSSPLCTGMTFERHQARNGKVRPTTVDRLSSCNLWVRRSFLLTHYFPEHYLRTEEVALLMSLKEHGARMFYSPELKVWHHRRGSLRSVFKPTFNSGYFRSQLMREKGFSGQWLFFLPALFVFMHGLIFFEVDLFLGLGRFYLSAILAMSLSLAAKHHNLKSIYWILFLHWFIVFVFGLGFLSERMRLKWR